MELTLDQKRAMAMASARARAAEAVAPAPATDAPGMAETAARSAVQGLTFGLADESYGFTQGVKGLFTGEGFGAGYDRGVGEFRAKDKAGREANPVTGVAAEIVGGLGTGLGAAKAGATLMKAGMSLPQMIRAGAVEGAAYGALHGAGNAEEDRLAAAGTGALVGAGTGAAVPVLARGVGALLRGRAPAAGVPTIEELGVAKKAAYKAADDSGVIFSPQAADRINQLVARDLTEIGFDPALQSGVVPALKRIQDLSGQNVTLTGLDTIRKVAGNGFIPGNKSNNLAISKVIEAIDNVTTSPAAGEVLGGDAVAAGSALKEARGLASREAKATRIADALYAAETRTNATGSGGNIDNASRQRLASILLDKNKSRGFTADERAALEQTIKGTKVQNLARLVGKLSPNGNGLMLAGNLAAAGQTSGASLPIAALGSGAKAFSDGATMRNASKLDELIRAGGNLSDLPADQSRAAIEAIARALLQGGGQTQSQKLY